MSQAITPALRQWIVAQAEAGFTSQAILESMCASGWAEDVAAHAMEDTLIALKKAGLKENVRTLVGGAPITQEYADSIGADGFGMDAMDGVDKAKALLVGTKRGRIKNAFESGNPSPDVGLRAV